MMFMSEASCKARTGAKNGIRCELFAGGCYVERRPTILFGQIVEGPRGFSPNQWLHLKEHVIVRRAAALRL
jgi:hypothetical protein